MDKRSDFQSPLQTKLQNNPKLRSALTAGMRCKVGTGVLGRGARTENGEIGQRVCLPQKPNEQRPRQEREQGQLSRVT